MVHVKGNNNSYLHKSLIPRPGTYNDFDWLEGLYKSLIPRPYHCYYDAGWLEDFFSIRRRLERLADSLSEKEREKLLHQIALANYYAKLCRPSIDSSDLI